MHEKEHVIQLLEQAKEAIKNEDAYKLRDLSNQTIHTASTEQDTDSILVAIIVYSLSQIIESKSNLDDEKCKAFCSTASYHINNAVTALKNDNFKLFEQNLNKIINSINKLSDDFKENVQRVFQKARINKASKIYEHGISMGRTANLLGITQYELANYAGMREDRTFPLTHTTSVKDRIKLAMDFFK